MSDTMQSVGTAARARAAEFAEQNARLEGLELSDASRGDSAEYVAGTITGAEMVTRARVRAGLEGPGGHDD